MTTVHQLYLLKTWKQDETVKSHFLVLRIGTEFCMFVTQIMVMGGEMGRMGCDGKQ
jgi:hypothetical protein